MTEDDFTEAIRSMFEQESKPPVTLVSYATYKRIEKHVTEGVHIEAVWTGCKFCMGITE